MANPLFSLYTSATTLQKRVAIMLIFATLAIISANLVASSFFAPDTKVQSMVRLNTQIEAARTALRRTRATQQVDFSAEHITAAPYETDRVEGRKALFLARTLPLVVAENNRILAQRSRIERTTSPAQLNALAIAYGLKPGQFDKTTLLMRADVVPPSLVLAQAALESAWGTSRFARSGNALFGERTFDASAPGIIPKDARGFKVKRFATRQLSIRSYLRTLNTNPAYRGLRQRRAVLRRLNEIPKGRDLALQLQGYSELGADYIPLITRTIDANQLADFDVLIRVEE